MTTTAVPKQQNPGALPVRAQDLQCDQRNKQGSLPDNALLSCPKTWKSDTKFLVRLGRPWDTWWGEGPGTRADGAKDKEH